MQARICRTIHSDGKGRTIDGASDEHDAHTTAQQSAPISTTMIGGGNDEQEDKHSCKPSWCPELHGSFTMKVVCMCLPGWDHQHFVSALSDVRPSLPGTVYP